MNKLSVLYKVIKLILNRQPQLNTGETWYIKLKNETALQKILISDVTNKTIEISFNHLTEIDGNASCFFRYKISDIEFVEIESCVLNRF